MPWTGFRNVRRLAASNATSRVGVFNAFRSAPEAGARGVGGSNWGLGMACGRRTEPFSAGPCRGRVATGGVRRAAVFRAGLPLFAMLACAITTPCAAEEIPLPPRAIARLSHAGTPEAPLPFDSLRELAFSPDGRWLAIRGEPGDPKAARRIDVWDVKKRSFSIRLDAPAQPGLGIAFSPDSKLLCSAVADAPAGIQLWTIPAGQPMAALPSGRSRAVFLPGSGQLASIHPAGRSEYVAWQHVANGAEAQRFVVPVTFQSEFSPDGAMLAATRRISDATVRLVDVVTGNELRRMTGGRRQPTALRFSRSGRTLAAAFPDEGIFVWEVATGERVAQWKPEIASISIAFSPEERWLAAGGVDGSVRLFAFMTNGEAIRLTGHSKPVSALAFAPDGRQLASGSLDRTAVLWDFATIGQSLPRPEPPLGEERGRLWDDLGGASAAAAYRAIDRVQQTAEATRPWLLDKVHRQLSPPERALIDQYVQDLDHPDSIIRQRATEELKKLRELARPVLSRVVKESASAEVRFRARRILTWADRTPRFSAADTRRMLRVLHAIAGDATPETRAAVALMLREFPDPQVKREADRLLQMWKSESKP